MCLLGVIYDTELSRLSARRSVYNVPDPNKGYKFAEVIFLCRTYGFRSFLALMFAKVFEASLIGRRSGLQKLPTRSVDQMDPVVSITENSEGNGASSNSAPAPMQRICASMKIKVPGLCA